MAENICARGPSSDSIAVATNISHGRSAGIPIHCSALGCGDHRTSERERCAQVSCACAREDADEKEAGTVALHYSS